MSKLFILFGLFLSSCQSASTETKSIRSEKSTNEFVSANVSSNEKQIAQYVVDLFEDSKGNLWMGTVDKGVAVYDGKKLVYYTEYDGLPGNTVYGFLEDKEGNIWMGGHHGLAKYDGKTFITVKKTSGIHDIGEGWISLYSDNVNNVWMTSNDGVFKIEGDNIKKWELPFDLKGHSSYSIVPGRCYPEIVDSKGRQWLSTDGYGAFVIDGDSVRHFTKKDGLCSNTVTNIIEDNHGNIWFSCIQSFQPKQTNDGGICVYTPSADTIKGQAFKTFPNIKSISQNDIYSLYKDSQSNIWIGATGYGVYSYDGQTFHSYTSTNRPDLTENFGIQAILEDSKGNLWFGFSGGLFRLKDGQFINVTQEGPWN